MRKALFLRPFRIVEWRKGLVCSSVGRPMSPNTRDPISELSKKLRLESRKMKKWQEERNYRRIYNEAGEVIANIITVDGVDVNADEGLTGTRMDQQEDFNRMMRDCRKGKIDRILVKSVSRFARNTKDCLSALRELSTLGVSVQFEKENIDTKTLTTELMVSVSASLAQQESISISANQKISYQRRMERGEFITCSAPYGYRIIDKKNLEIIPEEATTVQWIHKP